jgi:ABC-type multidrug transport system fused ATPase/permease subunit
VTAGQGDEEIASPATAPRERLSRKPRSRRRADGVRERASSLLESARVEVRLFARLFAYTRPYRGRLLLSWLATAGYAAAGALLVAQMKPIFDEALIAGQDVGRISIVIFALYTIKGACSYFSTTLVAAAGQRAVTDLRNRLYEHILKQSFAFLGRSSTGSLMSHITTDVERIQAAVSELAGDLLKEGLTILGLLAVLFYMDWRLALLSLLGMPLALHPLLRLGSGCGRRTRRRCAAGRTSRRSCRRRSPASAW